MTSGDFIRFYKAVHDDRTPFPWQIRLVDRLLSGGGWPNIAVPTACGKTSVLDAAVFVLAAQSDRPAKERTPLRIIFVVDRRLVVDDVTRHALQLAEAIERNSDETIRAVRDGLSRFGGAKPLQVATLRGGMYLSDTWADTPNQPLVCVSTVDQIGSRLLFRGYGVSDSRRPVDAALAGIDSLIILDEAHLSTPFLDTLCQVRKYQGKEWTEQSVLPGIQVVEMSATPRSTAEAIRLNEEDLTSKLQDRLEAKKVTELKETANLEQTASEEAVRLANAGAMVVGVVLNTVAAARRTFELLRKSAEEAILLTGRIRPYDRDRLLEKYLDRMKAGRDTKDNERLFIVATQTIEVGADLDFDALVTEAAPLDSLRQRFGRLNRIGMRSESRAVILRAKKTKGLESFYGEPLENTWKWLNDHGAADEAHKAIDFGVRKITALFEQQGNGDLCSEAGRGPLMFPEFIDTWVQTNPAPAAEPDIAPFLHGRNALDTADVQIVWRKDLPDDQKKWIETVSLLPPVSTEALPLRYGAAVRWLGGKQSRLTDIEGVTEPDEEPSQEAIRKFLIWRGPQKSTDGPLWRLRPGDTVIVGSVEGGADAYGWNPDSGPVDDIGDECAHQRASAGLGRYRVRVEKEKFGSDDDEILGLFRQWLNVERPEARNWRLKSYSNNKWLIGVSAWQKPPREQPRTEAPPEETDEDENSSFTGFVSLTKHTADVTARACDYATHCGLPADIVEAIRIAAEMHDLGKCDVRFQMLLDPLGHSVNELLAKGQPSASVADFRRRRDFAGYPKGGRHEFGSVAIAIESETISSDVDRDLVLHLIGTHHGYGRPLPPYWADDPAFETCYGQVRVRRVNNVALLDSRWTERFWMLVRRYGYWGLAYLEAIVRRADCVQSRYESEKAE